MSNELEVTEILIVAGYILAALIVAGVLMIVGFMRGTDSCVCSTRGECRCESEEEYW